MGKNNPQPPNHIQKRGDKQPHPPQRERNSYELRMTTANDKFSSSKQDSSKMSGNAIPRKKTIHIIGDSNTKFMDPNKMIERFHFSKTFAPTIEAARVALSLRTFQPNDIVVLHVGTNDLQHTNPHDIASQILDLACGIPQRVVISKILPRGERHLTSQAAKVNRILETEVTNNRKIALTSIKEFFYYNELNRDLFITEHKHGQEKLLHLNEWGQVILSRAIQKAAKYLAKN